MLSLILIIEDPALHHDAERRILGRTTIRVADGDGLADHFRAVPTLPIDCPVGWYDDQGLTDIPTDPYGFPLTWAPAFLLAAAGGGGIGLTPWNHAVLALLMGLGETRVILRWD